MHQYNISYLKYVFLYFINIRKTNEEKYMPLNVKKTYVYKIIFIKYIMKKKNILVYSVFKYVNTFFRTFILEMLNATNLLSLLEFLFVSG